MNIAKDHFKEAKMAGIGKLFKFGGKKPPEPPRQDYDRRQNSGDGDSDEESYIDPANIHSVLPPSSGSLSSKMPNYPPPRPNHPMIPTSYSLDRSHKGPSESVTKPTVKPRTVHTNRIPEGQPGSQMKDMDDYCDPWDARNKNKSTSSADDYCDPVDVSKPQEKPLDDYSDPWDSRKGGNIAKPKVNTTGVRDEYIDPWDAQGPTQAHIQQVKHDSDDSDSYTEPYDTGKVTVLDEQAKTMSLKGMRNPSVSSEQRPQTQTEDNRPVDDYESPWESKGLVKPELSPKPTVTKPQTYQTHMPTQDSRPCDDYDKPWEWTAKMTSQFTEPSKSANQAPKVDARPADDYDSPWEYNKRSSQLVSMATQPKTDVPVKPPRTMAGLVIDTTKPLQKQDWYHGPLTRVEAECLLKYEEDCSFLVRDSESSRKDYSLSLKNNNAFMHLKIVRNGDKFVLGQFSQPFDNVPEVIEHYSRTKLNIKGAEHKYLKNPVFPKHDYFVLEKR